MGEHALQAGGERDHQVELTRLPAKPVRRAGAVVAEERLAVSAGVVGMHLAQHTLQAAPCGLASSRVADRASPLVTTARTRYAAAMRRPRTLLSFTLVIALVAVAAMGALPPAVVPQVATVGPMIALAGPVLHPPSAAPRCSHDRTDSSRAPPLA